MLIYSKKVDEKMKLFGTLNNIPSDDDELLTYTDGEGKAVEPALSLSQSFVDGGKHSIKRVEDGKEIKVFVGDVNVIPGEDSPVPPTPVGNPYLTFSSAEPFSISTTNESKSWDGTLEYSTDTENWNEWDGTEVNSSEDGKLYFRGSNNTVISMADPDEWVLNPWILSGSAIACSGNIETLLDYQTVASGEHPQMGFGCYSGIFGGCTSLTTPPELPATTLAESCYNGMFSGCASLTTAPTLSATTLAESCYSYMFQNCTSLTTASALPATTLVDWCYGGMFDGCTALAVAPALPVTTLAESCYNGMFSGCASLTTIPELPATTLAVSCYNNMFKGCTSLTTAPELPATTLADFCYSGMFQNCTSLTTAPELTAITLTYSCYSNMFAGCTALTTAPELPATTLTWGCYTGMFDSCISLTTVPELSAITLTDWCYNEMFKGCTSIKLSTTQDDDYTTPYRIPLEGTGTNATGALNNTFIGTGGTFTGTPTINTTYYLHKDNHVV